MSINLRSMIFVPGYRRRFLERSRRFMADALILDLEDSVPHADKELARENIRQAIQQGNYQQQIYIRINPLETGLCSADLEAMMLPQVAGFMPTKICGPEDIVKLDGILSSLEERYGFDHGKFRLCPLIETAAAVMFAHPIALASKRMIALVFGGEDYLNDLEGLHKEHGTSLLVPRSLIVIAARAAGVEVIDTPFLDLDDEQGLKKEVDLARELGFTGTLLIHPSQIEIANAAFSPKPEEIRESRRIVASIEASQADGTSVALLDGKLIGPPMLKRALRILEQVERFGDPDTQ